MTSKPYPVGNILLLQHNKNGSVGLIINHRFNLQLSDAVENIDKVEASKHTLFFGGPAGPNCGPDENRMKPEISAPGSDIYSSTFDGGYGYKSGTSMAGPHVAGAHQRRAHRRHADRRALGARRLRQGAGGQLHHRAVLALGILVDERRVDDRHHRSFDHADVPGRRYDGDVRPCSVEHACANQRVADGFDVGETGRSDG